MNINSKVPKRCFLKYGNPFICIVNLYLFSVQEEKAMQNVPHGPIDASKFVQYVQERRKKRILFKGEYLVSTHDL